MRLSLGWTSDAQTHSNIDRETNTHTHRQTELDVKPYNTIHIHRDRLLKSGVMRLSLGWTSNTQTHTHSNIDRETNTTLLNCLSVCVIKRHKPTQTGQLSVSKWYWLVSKTHRRQCVQWVWLRCSALAKNCSVAKLDAANGAEAKDWKSGKPVRVVRNCKGRKHSEFAPEEGNRYDGIYKVP